MTYARGWGSRGLRGSNGADGSHAVGHLKPRLRLAQLNPVVTDQQGHSGKTAGVAIRGPLTAIARSGPLAVPELPCCPVAEWLLLHLGGQLWRQT